MNNLEVNEIKVNLPDGKIIAGKFWGEKAIRPFVCLHGWQDNAGTFDRLIPLLPRQFSYLAIDFLGHGKSSHIDDGAAYYFEDFLHVIHHLMKEFGWKKISLIGHSISSRVIYMYAALFPEKVDLVIGFDNLKPLAFDCDKFTSIAKATLHHYDIMYSRSSDNIPSYTFDELLSRLMAGTNHSMSPENATCILNRSIIPSEKHPGKYSFARDGRLKYMTLLYCPQEASVLMAKRLSMPYLFITGSNTPEFEDEKCVEEVLEILRESPNFEYHIVETNCHHFHLEEPEKVAGIIAKFIEKHRNIFVSHL